MYCKRSLLQVDAGASSGTTSDGGSSDTGMYDSDSSDSDSSDSATGASAARSPASVQAVPMTMAEHAKAGVANATSAHTADVGQAVGGIIGSGTLHTRTNALQTQYICPGGCCVRRDPPWAAQASAWGLVFQPKPVSSSTYARFVALDCVTVEGKFDAVYDVKRRLWFRLRCLATTKVYIHFRCHSTRFHYLGVYSDRCVQAGRQPPQIRGDGTV
jgi:hypothetical protein